MIKAVLCVFSYLRAQGVGDWTDPKYFQHTIFFFEILFFWLQNKIKKNILKSIFALNRISFGIKYVSTYYSML